jgi:hypothetical protein
VKKIKDERLILKTLKNIRIAFLFQSLGIIGILGYIGFTEGMDQATKSPLWLLFILTSIVLSYLQVKRFYRCRRRRKGYKVNSLLQNYCTLSYCRNYYSHYLYHFQSRKTSL